MKTLNNIPNITRIYSVFIMDGIDQLTGEASIILAFKLKLGATSFEDEIATRRKKKSPFSDK